MSKKAALCFKYNFLANGALDRNEVATAIDYYDKAIATGYADQQGVLLVSRRRGPTLPSAVVHRPSSVQTPTRSVRPNDIGIRFVGGVTQ